MGGKEADRKGRDLLLKKNNFDCLNENKKLNLNSLDWLGSAIKRAHFAWQINKSTFLKPNNRKEEKMREVRQKDKIR